MRKIKEISADTMTPISVYLRLKGKNKVILESIPRENDQSRFSIIALNPVKHIKFTDGILSVNDEIISDENPMEFLEKLKSSLLSARAERKLLCVRFSQYNRPVR